MRYAWNGSDGSYTDATAWAPEGVPLWDKGAIAVIQSGTVTLSDARPEGVSIVLAGPSEATQPNLVLDNAAFGSGVLLSLNPVFDSRFPVPLILLPNVVPGSAAATPDAALNFATITVEGYDTNQGTISLGAGDFALDVLTIAITPYSQLNQEGTISVNGGSVLQVNGTGEAPATLNNDGVIDIAGSSAIISADVIGSGAIAFAPTRDSSIEFGGGVSSTQHVSFLPSILVGARLDSLPAVQGISSAVALPLTAAVDVRIDNLSAFHGILDAFNSPADAVILANTQATGATFDQVTPNAGTLMLLNGQEVIGALAVTGAHAPNAYGVSSNLDGSTTVRLLSPVPVS